jgi:hypothetical protein
MLPTAVTEDMERDADPRPLHGVLPEPARPTLAAKLRAQQLVQDPATLTTALTQLWMAQGETPERAVQYARTRQAPHWSGHGTVPWQGDSEQLGALVQHGCLPTESPAPKPAVVPAPESRVEEPGHEMRSQPESTPAAIRPGKAGWYDKVPRAVTRDRRLSAESVRLYMVLLGASGNLSREAYPSQVTLAKWMGWTGDGGRNKVARALRPLVACGYVQMLVRGRRMGNRGEATRYRVIVGARPLAAEHDLRGEGGLQ